MESDNLLNGRDVLIVEDEILIALDVEHIVLACGAETCRIFRCEDALRLSVDDSGACDIIFVDHVSFHKNTTFFTALVKNYGAIIILTTSGVKPEALAEIDRVSIVRKPFTHTDIVDALMKLLPHSPTDRGHGKHL